MLEELLNFTGNSAVLYLVSAIAALLIFYVITVQVLRRYGKNPKYLIPPEAVKKLSRPILLILFSLLLRLGSLRELLGAEDYSYWFKKISAILFIFSFTWLFIKILKISKRLVISQYDVGAPNNLKARKIYTQFTILERIIIFVVVVLALGIALMSFEGIREIGVSIFASAGVAGIIIGFSAQKMIGTIIAGIQIAITQPIRIDDVVIVEGEWGRVEEITLTYVVIAIWDKRRLVVPSTYFIETPFQNWTKTSADILGTVFLYTDYQVPFEALRKELKRIVSETALWDQEVANIQVTNSTAQYVEVRALVSAKNASEAWDLRVHVREKLITFLQQNYPESIARTRVQLKNLGALRNTADD
ncbi:MAG TPA: mechanosensitive ion channel domain-containing protein [Eudoraea sp.]|nr:mechanosensitive ion channel domain-containing protein [Eudoraea sp.]